MKHAAFALCLLAASIACAAGPDSAVAQLTNPHTANEAWEAIVAYGDRAVPDLEKLAASGSPEVQARAAALLYRLGKSDALDRLAGLIESPSFAARREAAAALLAYVGQPMNFVADAPEDERAKQVAFWKAWWKENGETARKMIPMKRLYGKVNAVDDKEGLVAISLLNRHGASVGMRLLVCRGDKFICAIKILMAGSTGSVARISGMAEVGKPEPGDAIFTSDK